HAPSQEGKDWKDGLLGRFKKQIGQPVESPASWARLWTGLPPLKPIPRLLRWQDDLTILTYQHDSGGVELALVDRPLAGGTGLGSNAMEYLPRGPANCPLGMTRNELLQKWKGEKPGTPEDGALVLYPGEGGSYDALLVWFEKDRVARIIGRKSQSQALGGDAAKWGEAVTDAWHQEIRSLGWPRREEVTANAVLQGLGWHD